MRGSARLLVAALFMTACDVLSGLDDFTASDRAATASGGSATTGGGQGGQPPSASSSGGAAAQGGGGGVTLATGDFDDLSRVFDTGHDEDDPTCTADGLELYLNIDEGSGPDLYRSTRPSRMQGWGAPVLVTELSAPGVDDTDPCVSPDGLTIYFGRGPGALDIYMATRPSREAAWSVPVPVPELNSAAVDVPSAVTSDGRLIAILSRRIDGERELFFAERGSTDQPWGTPYAAAGVFEGGANEGDVWLSPDGLHMYWRHNGQIRRKARQDRSAPFGDFEVVDELDDPGVVDQDPWLLPDQSYIMFAREVGGGRRAIFQAFR